MPPASPAATSVERMASSSEVLPWSTWPMMVTTGARGCRFAGSSARRTCLLRRRTRRRARTVWPSSSAISCAVSASIVSVILRHLALLHQDADHVDRALGHAVGQFLDGDRFRDRHFAHDLFLRLVARGPSCAGRGGGTRRPSARALRRRSSAVTTVRRPRRFSPHAGAVGFGAGAGRATRRRGRGGRGAALRPRRPLRGRARRAELERRSSSRRRSASWRPRRPCAWFPRRAAALFFVALRASAACALGLLELLRGCGARASSSAILRSSASRKLASASAWRARCARPRSACAAPRRTVSARRRARHAAGAALLRRRLAAGDGALRARSALPPARRDGLRLRLRRDRCGV